MPLPPSLLRKHVDRFDELIREAQSLHEMLNPRSGNLVFDLSPEREASRSSRTTAWRTKCASLLDQILPANHVHRNLVKGFADFDDRSSFTAAIGALQAIKDDLEKGFLDGLETQIEAGIASDYMGQAEALLREGSVGNYDHIPAAVLAGAVLEKALRTLCSQQQPQIETAKANGEPKTFNPLIDDLKRADVFNEAKAKQLRAWADIRNHAAHGEFDQFTRADVEQMIPGIRNFLADYLK